MRRPGFIRVYIKVLKIACARVPNNNPLIETTRIHIVRDRGYKPVPNSLESLINLGYEPFEYGAGALKRRRVTHRLHQPIHD